MSEAGIDTLWVALWSVVGALIGSFGNVVVHRWPRGESVVRPRSRCPRCRHVLGPLELVPVVSWLALRARCRACGQPISWRYPLVEAGMAAGFGLLAWTLPVTTAGASALPLMALYAMLLMAALIDLDTYLLPDGLTIPAALVALAGAFVYHPGTRLPGPGEALVGAVVAVGILVLINRLGGLVLRRLRDTRERLWPISLDTVNLAALAGAAAGWRVALVVGGLQVLGSAAARRPLRLPEPLLYGAWAVALALAASGAAERWGVGIVDALAGSLAGAGAFAFLGAIWWWLADWRRQDRRAPIEDAGPPGEDDGEPVAMGFGDVKLAAPLGAMLGWQGFLVGLLIAVLLGAVVGVVQRLAGGSRFVPFGPFMVAGGFLALFVAQPLLAWYLGLLGV
jgi:leader peptidase (prepilin peptidase) / N-methyltransferase